MADPLASTGIAEFKNRQCTRIYQRTPSVGVVPVEDSYPIAG